MNSLKYLIQSSLILGLIATTGMKGYSQDAAETEFEYYVEQFADLQINRYEIPGWDKLTLQQKKYVYFLTQAGYEGRDIIWDQNYRHNIEIRKALENIYINYKGNRETDNWSAFETYLKRVWFSNGIHHHYSMNKITPSFSPEYFDKLLSETNTEFSEEIKATILNEHIDGKKVSLDSSKDLVLASATNFYGPNVTQQEVESYYSNKIDKTDSKPISYGLNSKLVKTADGSGLEELVWKADGMYGAPINDIISWLKKASKVAENKAQADAINILIEYYTTGDLRKWDEYNIAWTAAVEGDIDYINSFIEVYNDPLGFRGSFESIVEIKDFDASERMKVLMNNVQWFEDNSSILPEHKKEKVVGVTYKVVNVAGESGDASPSTPIGVNLPNANWIRATHGSKSVSLGNIVAAYAGANGSGYTDEFSYSNEEKERAQNYGALAGKLHTALHEVVGHASGKINEGIGTPKETLKNYASTLEEARADLVALYFILDPKLVELGLMPSLEVGKTEYDGYIRNGLMAQLRRIEPGEVIEEAHMRNRQLVASWAYERGMSEKVIEKISENGKTYFKINDYEKLQIIFGELLKEIQRIKSEGDYESGKSLVENYGVQVDAALHAEVLKRAESLGMAPYGGFINPRLEPVLQDGIIVDIKVAYDESFTEQMLRYSSEYGNL